MYTSKRKRRRDRHKYKFKLFSQSQGKITFKLNLGGVEAKLTVSSQKILKDLNKTAVAFAQKIQQGVATFINNGISERALNPCVFNSGNVYLKCAVNPLADCNDCPHYQKRSYVHNS